MGNSPSQEKSEGAEGEPDNFALDAISEDSSAGEKREERIGPLARTKPDANNRQLQRSGGSEGGSDPYAHPTPNQELAAMQDRYPAEAASTLLYQDPQYTGDLKPENELEKYDGRQDGSRDLPGKFRCNLCARRFKRQVYLHRHHKTSHRGGKPLECQESGKTFAGKDNLQQHAQDNCRGAKEIKQQGNAGAAGGAMKQEHSEANQRNANLKSSEEIRGRSFAHLRASEVYLNSYPAVEDTKMVGVKYTSADHDSSAQEEIFDTTNSSSPLRVRVQLPSGGKRKRGLLSLADVSSPRPESKKQRKGSYSPPTSIDSAESQKSETKEKLPKLPVGTSDRRGLQRLQEDTQSATLDTSSRAQAPKKLPLRPSLPEVDDFEVHTGMATSTGRRTFPRRIGKRKKSSDIIVCESDPFSEYDDRGTESDEMSASAPLPQKPRTSVGFKRPSKTAPKMPKIKTPNTAESGTSGEDATLNRRHVDKSSYQKMKRNSKPGVTGRFTVEESSKLEEYRDLFCAEHDIEKEMFNEMMTLAGRKGSHGTWPYALIPKREFRDQYYDVLPDRNRKSMARYRERNFQNAEGSRHWTEQDDEDIVRLVNQIGPKWVEIGQRLTRTQDAVQQRWKNKLQHRDKTRIGEWIDEEVTILRANVERAKKEGGLPQDASSDHRVSWSKISDRMGNSRTAQQCAGKWIILQRGLYTPAQPTPTTLKKRSVSLRSKKKRRKPEISDELIKDSAEEEDTNSDKSQEINDEEADDTKPKIQETVSDSEREQRPYDRVSERENEDQELLSFAATGRRKKKSRIDRNISTAISESGTPGLSKLRLTETPAKLTGLSQAFASTQVNTSSPRGHSKGRVPAWSQISDRPTPDIGIGSRPGLQPELEELEAQDAHQDVEEDRQGQSRNQALSGLVKTTFPVKQKEERQRSNGKPVEVYEEEADDDQEFESEDEGFENQQIWGKLEEDVEVGEMDGNSADGQRADVEMLSDSEGDSVGGESEEEESSTEYEESAEEGAGDDSGEADDKDSMVDAVQNDFMASIKETARKNQLARQRRMIPPSEESTSESGSDTDSDDD